MLFDLQSPGRRRVVRVVFGGLALIFAISFVFLGVGTGGGGFSFSDLFGGGSGDSSTAFDSDIEAAQKQLATNPNDTASLATLVQLQYSAATSNADSNGNLTDDGVQHLRESVDAWNRYVKATNGDTAKGPALITIQAAFTLARADFNEAAQATTGAEQLTGLQSVVDDLTVAGDAQLAVANQDPTAASFVKAAALYYQAGANAKGDAALAQAKAHSKGNEAAKLDKQLQPAKAQGEKFTTAIKQLQKQQQSQGAASGGGNPLGGLGGGTSGGLGGVGTGGL